MTRTCSITSEALLQATRLFAGVVAGANLVPDPHTPSSALGTLMVPVQASQEVGLNQAFTAMHWGGEFISGQSVQGERVAGINALTSGAFCPDSKQPEFKHSAVKILKADLPWQLLAVAWLPKPQLIAAHRALQGLMTQFEFAT